MKNAGMLAICVLLLGACDSNKADDSFCREVAAKRDNICTTARVDCTAIMQQSSPLIVGKVQACKNSPAASTSPTSEQHPEIGMIPCCVAAE